MDFFDQYLLLTVCQRGFRAKCSRRHICCGQSSLLLANFREGAKLMSSNSFDKVPYLRLLHKLHLYGVRGSTLHYCDESFLSNIKQRVQLGVKSKKASGVPQWSVLGPLLFLAYINNPPECVTNSETRLFADDSLLFHFINSQHDADLLQKDLSAL